MLRLAKSFFLLTVLFFITSCSSNTPENITDIIAPIKLTAGKADTLLVSDLFYAENYNLKFANNPYINIKYLPSDKKLILTADKNFEGFSKVSFTKDEKEYDIPVSVEILQTHTFEFTPQKSYKNVFLIGNFNQWNRNSLKMTDKNNDGTFEITLPFEAGNYEYKFYADGDELLDPLNPNKIPNGIGGVNSVLKIKPRHTDKTYLFQYSYDKNNNEYRFLFENKNNPKPITKQNVFAFIDNNAVGSNALTVEGNLVKVNLGNVKGNHLLRAVATNDGQNSNMQYIYTINGKPAGNKKWTWYDGVIYSLMIDRFKDGDPSLNHPIQNDSLSDKANYMGGDFQGIINELNEGYFDSLGINTLWISPVNDNPDEAFKESPKPHRWFSGYHGYWPIHHLRTEEQFGTNQKLKELVKTAHDHNIKVLLDFVSNHVHEYHPFYQNHKDWFGHLELPDGTLNLRFWDKYRLTTWFEPYLPSFDYLGSQEAVDVMSDNAVWWLKSTGADGFRHDAVKHVPNKFWRELTRKIKKKLAVPGHKRVYQIGETFGNYSLVSSYVNNGQLDAQFNFNLYNSAQAAFIDPDISFKVLDDEMRKTLDIYGTLHLMGNIMDSHDKNRFMAYADGDLKLNQSNGVEVGWNNPPKVDHPSSYKKLELYMAYMNSIPGLPVIYYGSEFGMTGASDPDNRRMMRFDDQLNKYEKETLNEVRQIVKLRDENPALRYGDFYTVRTDQNIYSYIRSEMNQRILVVLNKNESKKNVDIDIPEVYKSKQLVDLQTGDIINSRNNRVTIPIGGIEWRMFEIK